MLNKLHVTFAVVTFTILLLAADARGQGEAEKLIGHKDPAERVRGIALIVKNGDANAEDVLAKLLRDKDWEVVQRAAEGLGERGSAKATKALVGLAFDAPLRAIRHSAAESLKKVDKDVAAQQVLARLKGEETLVALEALGTLGAPSASKAILKHLKAEDVLIRRAAIVALGATGDATHLPLLKPLLDDPDFSLQVAAAAAVARIPGPAPLDLLIARLKAGGMKDVVERALIRTMVAHAAAAADPAAEAAIAERFLSEAPGSVLPRAVRLVAAFATAKPPLIEAARASTALQEKGLANADEETRVASAAALGDLLAKDALPRLFGVAAKDAAVRVRFHALGAIARIDLKGGFEAIARGLSDTSAVVREQACVFMAVAGRSGGTAGLRAALNDADWTVVLAAAVSLGKLQDAEATAPLAALAKHAEWTRRAAAVAGLGRAGRKEGLPVLVERVGDADPVVKATAHHFLKVLSGEKHKPDQKTWAKWWESKGDKFTFVDRTPVAPSDDGYDRSSPRNPYEVFKELDVIVLTEERDQLENLLKNLAIAHTLTRAGQVGVSGLHPGVIFMVNCPGQILGDDSERLSWLVRSGGHLISSCWGLTNTVAKTFPGIVSAEPQGKSPAGAVDAFPAAPGSPYLKDVFDRDTRPLYQLAGYQLINVHDRERVEVLIESAEAATSWGEGNLAAHFAVGHGVVFQSTNHFALQGLKRERFKTEDERASFAIERLGTSHERIRELRAKGILADQSKAAEALPDLTILRLIARFVHIKRQTER